MFDPLTGNVRVKQTLLRMLGKRRVPGAMLFTGEDGVGKRLFALELAKALNCRTPVGVEACDNCAICRRIPRIVFPRPDDKEANKEIIWSEFPDVGVVRPSGRNIRVDQMRDVEREANFRPYEGNAKIFIIEEADKLNDASSNALLKTLEEPSANTHLILITARPAFLLSTIRSRCQIIRFAPIAAAEIADHLVTKEGMTKPDADLLARVSDGSLGRALSMDLSTYKEQRAELLEVLNTLAVTGDRAKLLRSSEEFNDAKHKDDYEPRLNLLTGLIHDVMVLQVATGHLPIVNEDVRGDLAKAAKSTSSQKTAAWLRMIENHKRGFQVNVNKKVATDALFLEMAEGRS
jgi:DNA polymerase-3 subunit delta'